MSTHLFRSHNTNDSNIQREEDEEEEEDKEEDSSKGSSETMSSSYMHLTWRKAGNPTKEVGLEVEVEVGLEVEVEVGVSKRDMAAGEMRRLCTDLRHVTSRLVRVSPTARERCLTAVSEIMPCS